MSNCFSCNLFARSTYIRIGMLENFLGKDEVYIMGYYFFYCAQPNATSASIQNVKTNLREYYVNRLKIDYCLQIRDDDAPTYMMVFVLNVPDNYSPSGGLVNFNLSRLPSHTIPESVLYYDLVTVDSKQSGGYYDHFKNVSIDIKKPFRVLPSYKLVFLCYYYSGSGGLNSNNSEGTAQVEFAVN